MKRQDQTNDHNARDNAEDNSEYERENVIRTVNERVISFGLLQTSCHLFKLWYLELVTHPSLDWDQLMLLRKTTSGGQAPCYVYLSGGHCSLLIGVSLGFCFLGRRNLRFYKSYLFVSTASFTELFSKCWTYHAHEKSSQVICKTVTSFIDIEGPPTVILSYRRREFADFRMFVSSHGLKPPFRLHSNIGLERIHRSTDSLCRQITWTLLNECSYCSMTQLRVSFLKQNLQMMNNILRISSLHFSQRKQRKKTADVKIVSNVIGCQPGDRNF